ncbi:MAG TPA: response regulator [Kofleriaceae bacterium]|nr:response regulator [Kofleriaceae bacterium]
MPTILLADDDLELLFELSDVLEQSAYEVETAVNGVELIEAMAEQSFDLVISDVSMPWMTGIQASHAARYAGLATPILIITALRDEAIAAQVARLGKRVRLLRKPFDLEVFVRTVDELIGVPANQDIAR